MAKPLKPLSDNTKAAYSRILKRAFNGAQLKAEVKEWPAHVQALLHFAIRRKHREEGTDPSEHTRAVPLPYRVKKAMEGPNEEEALAFEREAENLPPGQRACALLLVKLGLRAQELYSLPRASIEAAVKRGELKVLRKGGVEQVFLTSKITPLFKELLATKAKLPFLGLSVPETVKRARKPQPWKTVGEILCTGAPISQYHQLRKIVVETGERAGLKLRPHLLRHAFASRMSRDGAGLFTIQRALGHRDISTTQRYVHVESSDIEKYLRE